jgi:enoyl-CoA hydratase/carnithine racemase
MAMMCDLLVAGDTARFSYPEGKIGITGGMIAALAGRIPHKIAMELMLLGEPISAARAYEAGLANRVAPAGTEIEAAVEMAGKIVDLAPLALAAMSTITFCRRGRRRSRARRAPSWPLSGTARMPRRASAPSASGVSHSIAAARKAAGREGV